MPVRVTIQMGHVPRTSGSTGTHREQEFNRALAPLIKAGLERHGFQVAMIGADDRLPPGDVFVSLHCDGSSNRSHRGGSVGYPDDGGRQLAHAWKKAHTAHGYPGGWLADNYTRNLSGYYSWRTTPGYRWRFLAEHGTTTNPEDERWLFSHLGACAAAHVDAIRIITGHHQTTNDPIEENDMDIIGALKNVYSACLLRNPTIGELMDWVNHISAQADRDAAARDSVLWIASSPEAKRNAGKPSGRVA